MNIQRFPLPSIALLIAPVVLAAAPAKSADPTPKTDNNACAWFASIDDWRELDNRNLLVWVSRNEFYHLELSAPLIDLDTAASITFVDHNHDGRVCGFGMDQVVVPRSSMFGSSTIIGMTKLDDAGLEQLAAQYKVKLGHTTAKTHDQPPNTSVSDAAKPAAAN